MRSLVVVGLVGALLACAWWPPSAWGTVRAAAQAGEARAVTFENAVAAALHEIRGLEPWAVSIDPADLNAWLMHRWSPWAEFAGDGLPPWVRDLPLQDAAVAITADGQLLLMLEHGDRIEWCRVAVAGERGSPVLVVDGAGVGRLPMPVALAGGMADALVDTTTPMAALELVDGRRVRIVDVAFQDGAIVVACVTEPAAP